MIKLPSVALAAMFVFAITQPALAQSSSPRSPQDDPFLKTYACEEMDWSRDGINTCSRIISKIDLRYVYDEYGRPYLHDWVDIKTQKKRVVYVIINGMSSKIGAVRVGDYCIITSTTAFQHGQPRLMGRLNCRAGTGQMPIMPQKKP